MSQHTDNDPHELEMALRINNLPVNSPSMLADAFRSGWHFHAAGHSEGFLQEQLAETEALNMSNKGK